MDPTVAWEAWRIGESDKGIGMIVSNGTDGILARGPHPVHNANVAVSRYDGITLSTVDKGFSPHLAVQLRGCSSAYGGLAAGNGKASQASAGLETRDSGDFCVNKSGPSADFSSRFGILRLNLCRQRLISASWWCI